MKFESGIPIPDAKKGGGRPRTQAVHQMGIGDSALCETQAECNAARRAIYALGGEAVSRKVAAGWRVWRTA